MSTTVESLPANGSRIPTKDRHEYWRTCFVAMPYKMRDLGDRVVDFDRVYKEIFKPAIRNVRLDGKKSLLPLRADETASSGLIIRRMLDGVLRSRLFLADLTTHNPNVMWELGARHSLVPSGTVLVRMQGVPIPFDVNSTPVPEYQHEPEAAARESRSRISKVLRETLRWNELDSPAYEAGRDYLHRMGTPEHPTAFGKAVIAAEEAAFHSDLERATQLYLQAEPLAPEVPALHERRSYLLWHDGRSDESIAELRKALTLRSPMTNVDEILEKLGPSRFLAKRFDPLQTVDKGKVRIDSDFLRPPERSSSRKVYVKFLPEQDDAYGKIFNQGFIHTTGGRVLGSYHRISPEDRSGAGIASKGKHGLHLNVKLGGGGFGGSGGGFGNSGGGSGGGFTP